MENQPLSDWRNRVIGHYQIIQFIGRGERSEVWQATDTRLRRRVALKILPPVLASEETYLREFTSEARTAAALEHPHILEVHDFGKQEVEQSEVVPYLVMPYIRGGTLRERLAGGGLLPVQESLRYLRQAALAIDYAHSRGVIHRDIKPATMFLRDDWLLLADFGLATILTLSTVRSQAPAGAGTPAYMAPEQALGQAFPASDRYSLAVVAYQLFAGREPFRGATAAETVALHVRGQIPPPRQWNPQIPPAVERLLLLALARQPEARPPSAQALVDALHQAWMRGVQVRSDDPEATLFASWSKHLASVQAGPSGGLATPVLPVVSPAVPQSAHLGSGPFPASGVLPTPGQRVAVRAASPPEGSLLEHKVGRRGILLGGAVAATVVIGGGVLALDVLRTRRVAPQSGPGVSPTVAAGPHTLVPGVPVLALLGHTDEVWAASWSPNGRSLISAGRDRSLLRWDLAALLQGRASGLTLATPAHRWTVANIQFTNLSDCVCWSPDGTKVIAGNDFTDRVYALDASGSDVPPTIYRNVTINPNTGSPAIYTDVIAGPLTNHFSVTNGAEIQVWNLAHSDQPETSYQASEDLGAMAWSSDGSMLAALSRTFGSSSQLFLWQATNSSTPQSWNLPQRDANFSLLRLVDTVAWSPTDPNLLLLSDADVAFIWHVSEKKPVLMLGAQGQAAASTPVIGKLSWSPNGRYVAGSYDRLGDARANDPVSNPQIFVWDVQTLLKEVNAFSADTALAPVLAFASPNALRHSQSITDCAWSPDGRYLATASLDKTVLIWRVDGSQGVVL